MRGRVLELLAVYGVGTVVAYLIVRTLPWAVIPVVVAFSALAATALRRRGWSWRQALCWPPHARSDLARVLAIWFLAATLLAVLTWRLEPGLWLRLPRVDPATWTLVMVFYPLLSALPQEVLFRGWFFERYETVFDRRVLAVAVNGILFGAAHVVMDNWIAVAATMPLGWLLGWTYVRTRSLVLVWIEHSLYGAVVFTAGLGVFFIPAERAAAVLDTVAR